MLNLEDLKGVIPPIVTPVDENENVDVDGLKRVIDHVLDGGVHGIFVMGSNGEFYAFDYENQKTAVETAVKHVNGRVPVYAGTSAITTKECIKLAKMAEEAGADAVTFLPPMFIQPNEEQMYEHFKTIAEATKLPVLLYNNPGKTTNNISVGLLKRLAQIDNIVGIKNTTLDFAQIIQYIDATKEIENFKVLGGIDYYVYGTLVHGGAGVVAGTANVAPKLVVEIYEKFMQNDDKGALDAQFKLIPLRNAFNYGTFPVVAKDCLNLMGLNVGKSVRPVGSCSSEKLEEIKKILESLDLL